MMYTPFDLAYALSAARSKSGAVWVKLKSPPCFTQSPSQPVFHPSTRTPSNPFSAAKSIYFFVLAVLAECNSPDDHVPAPICISHQIPIYLQGFTHETSPN